MARVERAELELHQPTSVAVVLAVHVTGPKPAATRCQFQEERLGEGVAPPAERAEPSQSGLFVGSPFLGSSRKSPSFVGRRMGAGEVALGPLLRTAMPGLFVRR